VPTAGELKKGTTDPKKGKSMCIIVRRFGGAKSRPAQSIKNGVLYGVKPLREEAEKLQRQHGERSENNKKNTSTDELSRFSWRGQLCGGQEP